MLARQIAIGFGIAVIFPLLIYYGVATFHSPPKSPEINAAVVIAPGPNATADEKQNYQEQERARQRDYREKQQANTAAAREFSRDLVFVSAPLGIAANLIGAYLPLYAIGTGLIFGGIFSVGAGYLGYWSYLDDWVRFVSLLAGFVILLFVGYHRIAGSNTRVGSP